jgi:hypothetical protein
VACVYYGARFRVRLNGVISENDLGYDPAAGNWQGVPGASDHNVVKRGRIAFTRLPSTFAAALFCHAVMLSGRYNTVIGMRLFVGVTDWEWFRLHASKPRVDEVNFWTPSPDLPFRALTTESRFYSSYMRPGISSRAADSSQSLSVAAPARVGSVWRGEWCSFVAGSSDPHLEIPPDTDPAG